MRKIEERIKLTLDENRMLVLVVEVLIGFQFQGSFQAGFLKLSPSFLVIHISATFLLLLTLAMLLAVPSVHHLTLEAHDEIVFARLATLIMNLSLFPFALSISLSSSEVTGFVMQGWGQALIGIGVGTFALICWYGIPYVKARKIPPAKIIKKHHTRLPLEDRLTEALTECRIVLPGTQAILGFQFISFLTDAFERLPVILKGVHLVALCFILVSAILLMTAPAYHRIAEKGEDSESFYRLVCFLLLMALAALGIGISLDFFLLMNVAGFSQIFSLSGGLGVLFLFFGCWFLLPRLKSI